ncbi:6-phospho-3-hexuloisomerase [Ruminococcaceae bacterium OttesenSCG-928-I18]|nr:6-phospho-3-hexuloisomerase [Ruminococcaceae bacterium OttesenSCG-928-I18]
MSVKAYCETILKELQAILSKVEEHEAEGLAEAMLDAKRIFLAGAGRSGFAVRAFAMRLMHMGFSVYVVGETVTPAIRQGDLLFVGSGSGSTGSLVMMAEKAKDIGAKIALVTIQPDSPIGRLADEVVRIPAPSPKVKEDTGFSSIQPMGSLFEQAQLLFYDAVILELMQKSGKTSDVMFGLHANLE